MSEVLDRIRRERKQSQAAYEAAQRRGPSNSLTQQQLDNAVQQTLSQNRSAAQNSGGVLSNIRNSSPAYAAGQRNTPSTLVDKATTGIYNNPARKAARQEPAIKAMPKQQSVGKTVFDVVDRGAGYFNQGVASTADFVANLLPRAEGAIFGVEPEATFTGQVLKPVTDATGKFKDYVDNTVAGIDARIQNDTRDSKVAKVAADIGSAAVAALPNAVLAFMSGGASATGTLAPQTSGVAATAGAAAKKLVSNPMFKVSAVQSLGTSYDEAKAAGATDEQAIMAATLSTAFNSAVEIGGGVETLPGELQNVDLSTGSKALKWVTSMLDEGKEEVVQGMISGLTEKAVFDNDKALYSSEDENAVVNPGRMAKEFGMGAAIGGILGGGQVLGNTLLNKNTGGGTPVDTAIQETLGQNKTAPVVETESDIPLLLPEQSEITKERGYPYSRKDAVYKVVEIPQEKVAEIEAYINTVDSATARKKYKRILKNLFSGQLFTNANTVANEIAYKIGIGSKGIGEIIARQPVNAQTLAMLEQLNEVVENAKYVASEPTSHENRRGVIRTDIFETDTMVGDQPGTAKMRVNVTKDGNKLYYATNKTKETKSPQPWADDSRRHGVEETASYENSIPTNTENVNAVGAAEIGFDPISHASNTYGAIEPGENPARVVDVPKSMDGETNVKQAVRTIMEADVTPDAAIPVFENEIVKGSFSAMPITDQAAADRAEDTINRVGYDQALADWRAEVRAGRVSKASVAVGETLYNAAVSAGDTRSAVKIAIDLSTQVRSAAQALQAVRMLKKMSPAAQLYGVKQSVDNLQKQLEGQYGDRAPNLVINEDLAANFLNAKTDAEKTAAEEALYKDIARQIPATVSDKWNAWRYLSMLGNPRTHIRNIIGNAAFAPVRGVKNQLGGLMEAVAHRAGIIDKNQRTKSVGFNWSKKRRNLVKAAKADYANVEGQIQSGDKYNSATDIIEKNRRIFDWAVLETLRKGNSTALDVEDQWFSKGAYASSLAGYLNARGYTAEDFTGNGMTDQQKDDARAYAILEAQKATYRDLNALSELVTSMKFKNPANSRTKSGEMAKRLTNTVVEGVLPFKKTPANILARAVEYSPAGLAKALTMDSVQVARGKISAAEYMDHLASGLTGTGLFALGYFLAQRGILVGGSREDEDQFDLEGRQPYALEVGGTSVTLDWLAPEALPVFMGVELCKAIEDVTGQAFSVETIKSFFRGVTGPLLEMSMLSGLQDALDAVSYADDKMTAVVANAALGYLGQAVPTLFGQIERIIGNGAEIRQTTFTQDEQFLDKDTQYALGNTLNKVPFADFQQIPYIDAWGRTESTGGVGARAANNLFNPAYVSKVVETPVDAEIKRLEKQTGKNLTPARADKVLTVDGEKIFLTADEYVTYATAKGQNDYTFRENLIDRDDYTALDDQTKAKAMEYAKEYADALAREETGLKSDMAEWMAELEGQSIDAVTQRLVEKAAESRAGDKKQFDNKYVGISELLGAGTIDDKVALALMSDSAVDGYMDYCKKSGVTVSEYADVYGYMNKTNDKEATLKYIERLNMSKAKKVAIAQGIYGASPTFIPIDSDVPKNWLLEMGATQEIVAQFSDSQKELYDTYIRDTGVDMGEYLEIWAFKNSAKSDKDANGKTTYSAQNKVIDQIDRLNRSNEYKRNMFLGMGYSEKNIPYWWK